MSNLISLTGEIVRIDSDTNTKISTLETSAADFDERIYTLETAASSSDDFDNRILTLETSAADFDNRIYALELEFNITLVDSSPYNVSESDYILHVTYTDTGSVSIVIPTNQIVDYRILIIKDAGFNSSTNNIVVSTEGAETIDEEVTLTISGNGDSISLYCFNGNLFVF
jgi:hypothetical protein